MTISLAYDVWNLVRESIPLDEKEQLADTFVGILIEHGFDLNDIDYSFEDDADIQQAIKYYRDDNDSEDDDEEESYSDDDDEY